METVNDIIKSLRNGANALLKIDESIKIDGKIFNQLANRIEKAFEFELAVERSKAAGRGYAVGKQSAMEMKRIVLDCSKPERGCAHCVFNRDYGCVAPAGLDDCYKHSGVWLIIDGIEGGQK